MIKLVHAITGGDMWVHESRLEEYLAAGHKLAAHPKKEEAPKVETKQPAAKKTTTKKTTTK